MFNVLKMDLRRLFRTRSFYIVLAVTTALITLMVGTVSLVANPEQLDALQSSGVVVVGGDDEGLLQDLQQMTQLDFVHECLGSGFLLVIACIGVTLFVHGDFSSGYIKNICFACPRRWKHVLSKALVAGAYSAIIIILGVVLSLLYAFLFRIPVTGSPIGLILQYTFWMWLPCWAFALMGMALVLLTRSSTLGIIMAVISGSGLTAAILQYYRSQFDLPALEEYLLSTVAGHQCAPMPGMEQISMILGCAAAWAGVYLAGSFITMEKRDI